MIFLIASGDSKTVPRLIIGLVLLVSAGALIAATRLQPQEITVEQKIDLSGDVSVQDMKCTSCGGTLGEKSISVKAGAVFVNCEYCGAAYQLEEAPKW
ncbi:MAG: hypothetical protein HY318_01400 [Armatimonadetes bacterium]|nr:hypothetical protein [Armatimonadota bacterium]